MRPAPPEGYGRCPVAARHIEAHTAQHEDRRSAGRLHSHVLRRVLVWLGLAGFVVGVYVVVVRGGGALIGRTDSPSVALSVLATATVALSFARVQAALERWVSRLLGARLRGAVRRAQPVLRRACPRTETTDELPARMARLLAEGTGAQWAQVWVSVSGRLTLAATWPADADATETPPDLLARGAGCRRSRACAPWR